MNPNQNPMPSTDQQSSVTTFDLVAFLNSIGNVAADRVNPAFKSRYSSLSEVLLTIKEEAKKHNLALRQVVRSDEGKIVVVTSFLHTSGREFDAGEVSFKSDGLNPQQLGSALTYLRRQSACTACCISVDLDDDGAKASTPSTAPASGKYAKPTPSEWFAFIPLDQREKAVAYLTSKGWLPEGGTLNDLLDDKIELIAGNHAGFIKAIAK
jgi:hypothetical protein